MFDWFFPTRTWQRMHGAEDGETGVDDNVAAQGFEGIGAYILGRNMFGPLRGPWPDENWKGWWGDEPPYHTPVFVLTHHPRAPLKMEGGTEFRFVTDGAHSALDQAKRAAGGKDVRLGGGVSTIRQYLSAGLIDELQGKFQRRRAGVRGIRRRARVSKGRGTRDDNLCATCSCGADRVLVGTGPFAPRSGPLSSFGRVARSNGLSRCQPIEPIAALSTKALDLSNSRASFDL